MLKAGLNERKRKILGALKSEMARQGSGGPQGYDLVAIAVAVDHALGGDGLMPHEPYDDGKEPDELNAANDG